MLTVPPKKAIYMSPLSSERQKENITPRLNLQFEMHLVEHCNLNCQMCTHFSPLACPKYTSIDVFSKDMSRIHKLFNDDISYIMLLGGEPLLHPMITDFIKVARKKFPYTNIILYTNGLKLPEMNSYFWTICRENNITITLTKYPIQVDYNLINCLLYKNKIAYNYCNTPGREKKSSHYPLDINGKQSPIDSFINCDMANRCIFLRDGKLYTCPVIPNIHHFNKYFNYNLEVSHKDYIDIYQENDRFKIMQFLATPPSFCRYCDVSHRTILHEWTCSKLDVHEWT